MLELFEFYLKDKMHDIEFFIIENYSYGSVGQLADLGELGGLLKYHIYKSGKWFDVIAPTTVKKNVTGNGRASKKEVQDALECFLTTPDIKYNNFDESDSVAIGIAYAIKMNEAMSDEHKKD